jgi:hypothetical protein
MAKQAANSLMAATSSRDTAVRSAPARKALSFLPWRSASRCLHSLLYSADL